jgi:hypothetical protein
METAPETYSTSPIPAKRRVSKKLLVIILAAILVIAGLSWYTWNHNQQQKAAKEAADKAAALVPPPGWTKYQSQKYGFQFIYPKTWGPVNVIYIPQKHGKQYTISFGFASEAASKNNVGDISQIKMDSTDFLIRSCDEKNKNQCSNESAYTKVDIEKALSGDKIGIVAYDNISYTIYDYSSYSQLEINQIVDLPKINVTAAKATLQRYSPITGCSMDKLQIKTKAGCIGQKDYSDMKKILYSLQPL